MCGRRDEVFSLWMNVMSHRLTRTMRRLYPLLGAGLLLQASSCTFNDLGASLASAITNQLITNFVFGVFNLRTGL